MMLTGMTVRLVALVFDAHDPRLLARFWAGVLRWDPATDGVTVVRPDGGFRIRFAPTEAPKAAPNQMHFDLTSATYDEQQATVARVLELGGQHLDIGQLPEEEHVVMADPEGNEFCVIEAGNNFLADTDTIGAFSSDGLADVGYFWSAALGWPLVWDQDTETAIQSPRGGSKISWGGEPVAPKLGRNRLRFELELEPVDGDRQSEVDRLLALGATQVDDGSMLADPGGNEFCVRAQNT